MGPQVLQGTAPAQSSHSVTASSRHPPALLWGLLHQGPPRAAGAQLPHHGLYYMLKGNLFSSMEHLLPLLLLCSWGPQGYGFHLFPLLFLTVVAVVQQFSPCPLSCCYQKLAMQTKYNPYEHISIQSCRALEAEYPESSCWSGHNTKTKTST